MPALAFKSTDFNGVTPRKVLNLFSYSMEQRPSWERNRFSASQEIPRILRNSKTHYRIHKSPPPVPILSVTDTSIWKLIVRYIR
jgi:hypothetical protein